MPRLSRNVVGKDGLRTVLNEEDPTQPGFSGPNSPGVTGRADWSWDR
jgi:hypothetical protein